MTALQRATQPEYLFEMTLPPGPYPGLRPFEPSEWPIFFGRERMADEVITRLVTQRFVVVHGDSGSGKSSLIYAGVLPALVQQAARGGLRWLTCYATPGDDPILNLARSLAGLDGREEDEHRVFELQRAISFGRDGATALASLLGTASSDYHVCILVDQFEEIFAHARQYGSRDARVFIDFLIGLQERKEKGLYAILTMRSEFLGACAQFRGFAEAVNRTQYLLPRMDRADLIRAIQEPATLYAGAVERGLAERLIDDVGGTQDQLPLIQHGLLLLHRRRAPGENWTLTLKQYTANGGDLADLLSARADEVANGLTLPAGDEHPRLVEDLFRALTDINADGQAVRRAQKLSRLIAVTDASPESVRHVIDAFRAEGVSFLRPYGDRPLAPDERVDISHEALIRCWKQISHPDEGWLIREFRNGLVWRSLLVQADSFEKNSTSLLSPATTEERVVWLKRRNAAWCERYGGGWDRVIRLIDASVAEVRRQQAEAAREEEENKRREKEEQDRKIEEQKRKVEEQKRRAEENERNLREKAAEALGAERVRRAKALRKALYVVIALAVVAIGFGIAGWIERQNAIAAAKQEAEQRRKAELSEQSLRVEIQKTRQALAESDRKASQLSEYEKQAEALKIQLDRALSAAPQNSALRTELAYAQKTVTEQAQTVKGASRLAPRIYLQISDEAQREAARFLATQISELKLGGDPLFVPGIELRRNASNALRCFRSDECNKEAQALLELINKQLTSPKLVLHDLSKQYGDSNSIRQRHYEVWFAAGDIAIAGRPAQTGVNLREQVLRR
jgi:hypothetical protein